MILASYAVQVKFSDYDEELHQEGYLSNEKLLPESTTSKHNLTSEEWEEKVCICVCMYVCMNKQLVKHEHLQLLYISGIQIS